MPRSARFHVPGGYYHVVLRGNHREVLFGTAADRQFLNDIVANAISRHRARVHAFCWMSNHLHALFQIAHSPLGGLMQSIAMRYARYRHKQLQTTGHLFERRYGARLVETDDYFLAVLRYIHLNPLPPGSSLIRLVIVGPATEPTWAPILQVGLRRSLACPYSALTRYRLVFPMRSLSAKMLPTPMNSYR
jgi:REP element-mobilizing transposase RayT